MRIIGFYTKDTPYEDEYLLMKESMDAFNLSYHVYPIDNKGKWEHNCGMKGTILRQALDDFPDDNILYLDVDARILRQPPFHEIEKNIPGYCVWHPKYRKNGELASGTIYFPNNGLSREVLDEWIKIHNAQPDMWDQRSLQTIYDKHDHFLIHHDWINIMGTGDEHSRLLETDTPIILHTQASRQNKTKL